MMNFLHNYSLTYAFDFSRINHLLYRHKGEVVQLLELQILRYVTSPVGWAFCTLTLLLFVKPYCHQYCLQILGFPPFFSLQNNILLTGITKSKIKAIREQSKEFATN